MNIKYQLEFIQAIRNFFTGQDFIDVPVPPMVENPGMETHIHPFQLKSVYKNKELPLYLHTSPEFYMKRLLTEPALNNIFTIGHSFRDEPRSPIHREQFLMLEWYRKNVHYSKIMDDMEELTKYLNNKFSSHTILNFERKTIRELFIETINFHILDFLNTKELKLKIEKDFKDVPLPSSDCSWDDYFFLLFLNKVEPLLKEYSYLLLYEFPAPLAALSTIKENNPNVCERFEVYMDGIEICNCFNELTNYHQQELRFNQQAREKKNLYNYQLPRPEQFYNTLNKGLPMSAGIALGIERYFKVITQEDNCFFD